MADVPPPEQPGWYADAQGAWWWWDGSGWTAAPAAAPIDPGEALAAARRGERTLAMVVWALSLVAGFVGPLVLYFAAGSEKRFVRHHAAEALNLAIVMAVPQLVAGGAVAAGWLSYALSDIDATTAGAGSPPGWFWIALAAVMVVSILNTVLTIVALVRANSGRWWRLPIGVHPVRGVLPAGDEAPYSVT